jgi:hypothetical protein
MTTCKDQHEDPRMWSPAGDAARLRDLDHAAAALRARAATEPVESSRQQLLADAAAAEASAERVWMRRWRDLAKYLALRHRDPRRTLSWP